MKKTILTSIFSLGFAFAFAQGVITFETTTHEFGEVKETGGPITHDFKFKNTGDQPIIISNVQASCGCTTPDWTKTPVAPGQSGSIKAQYNPLGRPGAFNKSMTITSNSIEATTVVFIKGTVVPDAAPAAAEAPTESSAPVVAPSAVPAAPAVKATAPAKKAPGAKAAKKKPVAKKKAAPVTK
jgi:hypothetical protein